MATPSSERDGWERKGCQSGDCGIAADIVTPKTAAMPRVKLKAVKDNMPKLGSYKRPFQRVELKSH